MGNDFGPWIITDKYKKTKSSSMSPAMRILFLRDFSIWQLGQTNNPTSHKAPDQSQHAQFRPANESPGAPAGVLELSARYNCFVRTLSFVL
jgi:hypothetical protein